MNHLIGKKYTFADSDSIEVIQIKIRDDGPYITVHITKSNGIPQKLVMPLPEFNNSFGHLFKQD